MGKSYPTARERWPVYAREPIAKAEASPDEPERAALMAAVSGALKSLEAQLDALHDKVDALLVATPPEAPAPAPSPTQIQSSRTWKPLAIARWLKAILSR